MLVIVQGELRVGKMGNKRTAFNGKVPSRKRVKSAGPPIPLPREDDALDISEDDIDFVAKHAKDLAFLDKLDAGNYARPNLPKASAKADGGKDSDSNREEDTGYDSEECGGELEEYERQPRGKQQVKEDEKDEKAMPLPIKTPSGDIVYQRDGQDQMMLKTSAQELAGEVEGIVVEETVERPQAHDVGTVPSGENKGTGAELDKIHLEDTNHSLGSLGPSSSLLEGQSIEERRQELKDQMASSASRVLKGPEDNMSDLKPLLAMLHDCDPQIQCLAMLSLYAVFKDICPGYRIRLPTDKEKAVKVSKEVARLQAYEAFILRCYQIYLKKLLEVQKTVDVSPTTTALKKTAFQCMGGLLSSLHHFNYSSDILQAVVPQMCSNDEVIRKHCCHAVAQVVAGDAEGKMVLEAVQLVGDLVKTRKCLCPDEVLEALSDLKFPSINLAKDEDPNVIRKKKKKKKKLEKEDNVQRSFQASEANLDMEEKASLQTQTVEALFEIFFRVLKECGKTTRGGSGGKGAFTSDEVLEKSPMLYQALKGLSRFAHVLSVEYFQDLLEVFRQLLASSCLPLLERLCCLLTASDILQGEGEALNIDNRDYYQQLYWTLKHWWPVKLIDGSTSDENNAEANPEQSSEKGSMRELETLLIQVVNQMICESKRRDYPRLAAFVKRLMTLSLHQGTAVQMGIEAICNRLLLRHHRLRGLLDGEGGAPAGGKGHNPHTDDPSEAFALSSTLWELDLLCKHFHPHVSQGAKDLASIPLEVGQNSADTVSSVLSAMDGPVAVASRYSASNGTFWPLPKVPGKMSKAMRKAVFIQESEGFASLRASCSTEEWENLPMASSMRKLFRESKLFMENRQLRKELRVVETQLTRFKEHLESQLSKPQDQT